MEALHGIDGVLFIKKLDQWVPYGCAENVDIDVSTESISVKTIGDGMWSTTRPQRHSYTVSCTGIVQYTDPDNQHNIFDSLTYQLAGSHVEWMISYKQNDRVTEYTQLRGYALVKRVNIAAPNDFVNSSVELEGKGELLVGPPPTCSAEISEFTVTQLGLYTQYQVAILELVEGTVPKYNWRIDGGGVNTAFDTGWTFSVAGLGVAGLGPHTLEIWPVCENEIEGVKTTYNFITNMF